MLSKARLTKLVDAVVATIMSSTSVAQAKKFSLRGDGHPDVLCVLSLDNGHGYALLDKLNTTSIERVVLIPMVSDRLVAAGDVELDRSCEYSTLEYIDVHPCVPSANVDISKSDQIQETVRANESIGGAASASSPAGTGTDSSATAVVDVHTQQIADAVYRTIMTIPKFQDKSTRFHLTEATNGVEGVVILTENWGRDFMSAPEIRDHAECKAVNEIVTSRLVADGFQLDRSLRISVWASHLGPTMQMQPIEIVEPKPKPAITDHASFFRAMCLNAVQQQLVQSELPVGAPTDDLQWLSCFSGDVLRRCTLSDVQITMWAKLIAEMCA